MTESSKLMDGARNLLQHCGGFLPGDEILILHEDPAQGWYDAALPARIAFEAARLGLHPKCVMVGAPSEPLAHATAELSERYGNVIYFARIGDQDRFAAVQAGKTKVMCYIRNEEMLTSAFGMTDYRAMQSLKKAVDQVLTNAKEIEVTCPLGSHIVGTPPKPAPAESTDVSIRRFPLGVPQPLAGQGFSGKVALARYLTPTGSQAYDPAFLKIDSTVFAQLEAGRIVSFSGDEETVDQVEKHYAHVARVFDIDPAAVHSWHAGIHAGCSYGWKAGEDPDRWSNTVFNSPRILHFHTCGAYAPGEICWMLLDHTVRIDGTALWEGGCLRPERFVQTQSCLEQWPELETLFKTPSTLIGI